jgi:hypothetical protein
MWDSVLLYAGLIFACAGLLSIIWLRWRGVLIVAGGALLMVIAFVLPASEKRAASRASHLDNAMPVWQFDERHAIDVAAPPERVFDAILKVRADEIALFRTLTTIRCLGRCSGESIMNPPKSTPILEVATRTSFRYLALDSPREVVVGTWVAPGTLATMNFLVADNGRGGSHLSTETRVFADSDAMRRRFAIYWRIIHPGSDIIRRSWLQAIKRRAERT